MTPDDLRAMFAEEINKALRSARRAIDEDYLTTKEVEKKLRVSRERLYQLRQEGKLQSTKSENGRVLYSAIEIENYLQSRKS